MKKIKKVIVYIDSYEVVAELRGEEVTFTDYCHISFTRKALRDVGRRGLEDIIGFKSLDWGCVANYDFKIII